MQSTDWMDQARCREIGAELWFPGKGDPARDARRICNGDGARVPPCPVRRQCLAYALSLDPAPLGIYGGTTYRERRALRQEQEAA